MSRVPIIIAVSATIALTIAIATEPRANVVPEARVTASAKADRLDMADRGEPCRMISRPHILAECGSPSSRVATRTVTIEQRPQPGVSVLVRVPVEDVAGR